MWNFQILFISSRYGQCGVKVLFNFFPMFPFDITRKLKQSPEVFCKKSVLKNFARFIGKHKRIENLKEILLFRARDPTFRPLCNNSF